MKIILTILLVLFEMPIIVGIEKQSNTTNKKITNKQS